MPSRFNDGLPDRIEVRDFALIGSDPTLGQFVAGMRDFPGDDLLAMADRLRRDGFTIPLTDGTEYRCVSVEHERGTLSATFERRKTP